MSVRVSENYSILSGLFALLAAFQLLVEFTRNQAPSFMAIGLIASGVFFGIGFGGVGAKRQLSMLEKNSQTIWSLHKTLYLVGGLVIFAGGLFHCLPFFPP